MIIFVYGTLLRGLERSSVLGMELVSNLEL
jgi:hypothetical protein